jgi:LysM repeat protein
MKKLCSLLLALSVYLATFSQGSPLMIRSEGGKLFLTHSVVAKENWYSIGRMYNVSPKELSTYNGMSLDKGLSIGQNLKIPLTTNFAQRGSTGGDEVFIPLYHTVKEKEGLYRISQQYDKVAVEDLRNWNNLKANDIPKGMNMIVGYLRVKKDQSPLASAGVPRIGGPVDTKAEAPATQTAKTTTPAKDPSGTAAKTVAASNNLPKENPTSTTTDPVKTQTALHTDTMTIDGGGYFKELYSKQVTGNSKMKSENGQAAVFKSTSGWNDGKYYALMTNITPGTIVKVTNTTNNRSIYAKVLGEIPTGRESEGLIIRVSNAAAAELKVNEKEPRFIAELSYVKQ